MSKKTLITPQQKKAAKDIVAYLIHDERRSLEETLSEFGEEYEREMTDEELVKACKETGNTDHAWYKLHILSTIK